MLHNITGCLMTQKILDVHIVPLATVLATKVTLTNTLIITVADTAQLSRWRRIGFQ